MVLNLLRHFLTQVDISYWQRIRSRECQDDGLNYEKNLHNFDLNIRLQFHCAICRIPGHVDSVCPRYFLMLNDEIIWDWPKDCSAKLNYKEMYLVYRSSASDISDLINVYLNADRQSFIILKDDWGTLDIFRAADRRIGRR